MQSNVEQLGNTQKKINIEFSAEEVDKGFVALLSEIQPKFEMRGYRRGKVPLSIIERKYGSYIPEQVKENLIRDHYEEIVGNVSESIVSMVPTDISECRRGNSFSISFEVGIIPNIEVKGYEGIQIKNPVYEITDELLYKALDTYRIRKSKLELCEDKSITVQKDSIVEVSYDTNVENDTVGGLWSAEKETLEFDLMGEDQPCMRCSLDFRKLLIGMKVGDLKNETVTLPENYKNKKYAGKTGDCSVSVLNIYKRNKPEINDEFAKELGYESKDALLKEVKETIEKNIASHEKSYKMDQINSKLLEANSVEVPSSYVEQETLKRINEQFGQYLKNMNMSAKEFYSTNTELKKNATEDTEKSIKLGVIYKSITDKEKIEVSQEEISKALSSVDQYIRSSTSSRSEYRAAQERLIPRIYQAELTKKIEDLLLSKAVIEDSKEEVPQDLLYFYARGLQKQEVGSEDNSEGKDLEEHSHCDCGCDHEHDHDHDHSVED